MARALNMWGEKLTVAVSANPPHTLNFDTEELDVRKVGYELKILDIMSRMFNFTYNLENTNGDSGRMLRNGSWTGIVGQLSQQKADIGFGGLTLTPDRLKIMDFLPTHLTGVLTFITNWPKSGQMSLMEVMNVDKIIFVYLFISVVLLAVVVILIGLYFPDRRQLPLIWTLIVIFIRQKMERKVVTDSLLSLRTVLIVWQLMSMIVTILYSGFIYKSFATHQKLDTIDSLEQLAKAQKLGHIDIFINGNSARYTELKDTTRPTIRSIYQNIKFIDHSHSGVDLVRNSNQYLAYIDYDIKFMFELYKRGQKTYHIPPMKERSRFRMTSFAFGIRRGFPYKEHFTQLMNGVISSGLINYWLKLERNAFCGFEFRYNPDRIEHGTFDVLDNDEAILTSMLRIIYYGLSISFVTFLIELIVSLIKNVILRNKSERDNSTRQLIITLHNIIVDRI